MRERKKLTQTKQLKSQDCILITGQQPSIQTESQGTSSDVTLLFTIIIIIIMAMWTFLEKTLNAS